MSRSAFLLFLTLVGTAFTRPDDYTTYCNGRFAFCIRYPKSFQKEKEAQNGDGTTFISKDKRAKIAAWGSLAIEGLDKLEQEFSSATQNINVTYKTIKDTWFVFSGTDNNGAFIYQKTAKKKIDYYGDAGTPVFQTVRISYPANQQKNYEGYCNVIAKSL